MDFILWFRVFILWFRVFILWFRAFFCFNNHIVILRDMYNNINIKNIYT